MKISLICVGKVKEAYYRAAIKEYTKRLGAYSRLDIIEVADEPCPEHLSQAQMRQVKEKEGERILARLRPDDYVWTLEIGAKMLTSKGFSKRLADLALEGRSSLVFVIGGSLGLADAVKERSNQALSFSALTFPHMLVRLILLEQIYRAFRIQRKEPYHKGCQGDVDM